MGIHGNRFRVNSNSIYRWAVAAVAVLKTVYSSVLKHLQRPTKTTQVVSASSLPHYTAWQFSYQVPCDFAIRKHRSMETRSVYGWWKQCTTNFCLQPVCAFSTLGVEKNAFTLLTWSKAEARNPQQLIICNQFVVIQMLTNYPVVLVTLHSRWASSIQSTLPKPKTISPQTSLPYKNVFSAYTVMCENVNTAA